MAWASVVTALLSILGAIANAWSQQKGADAALAQSVAQSLAKVLQDIRDAKAAKQTIDDAVRADPNKLRADDGFERKP